MSPDATVLRLTRSALAVTVAAAPLYVVRWHIGSLPTTLLEALILITCALYIVSALRRGPRPSLTSYEIPIALLLLAGLVGIFIAGDHRAALGAYRAYLVEPVALFYVATAVLDPDDAIARFLSIYAVGAAAYALVQLGTFAYVGVTGHIDPSYAPGAFGVNPNSVSLYLGPLLGVAVGFALYARGRARSIGVTLTALLALADLSTLSRGGLVAIGVLFLVVLATTQSWRRQLVWVAVGIVGVLAVFKLPIIGPRLLAAADPAVGTFVGRGRIWAATVRMLRDHPIFGAGLNAYQTAMAPYRRPDPNLVPEPYAHNVLLSTWSELGVLGAAVMTYLLASLLVRPWLALRRAGAVNAPLLWGCGAACAMIVTHGLVDTPYWKNDLSVEFWMLAALEVIALRAVRTP